MSYSLNRFLRPLQDTDKTVRIFDDRNYPVHTINPFSVLRIFVTNSNLNVALSGNRTIVLDFPSHEETKDALQKLQLYVDQLKQKAPQVINQETEKYIEQVVQIASAGGLASLNGITASGQSLVVNGDDNLDIAIESSGHTHSITLNWSGILPIERGGLNNTDFSENQLLISSVGKIISSSFTVNDSATGSQTIWSAEKVQSEIERDIFSYKEKPVGFVDGINAVFLLESSPVTGSEHVFMNGLLQNVGGDYTIVDNKITFFEAPPENSLILCSYRKINALI